MQEKLRIIISGGGTGGHIYPAIAVAQTLERMLPDGVEFLFVGASDRMEMEKVPKAGYAIEGLWISGLQRSLSPKNILFPFKVISSVWRSLEIINTFKPHLAIGFGGYASGAMMYAATLKGIPSMIHEQNSYAGITNKILKNRVQKIAVAYTGMERFFPADKLIMTGNPVRPDILLASQKRAEAFSFFGLNPSRPTLLVIGGSLGARTINQSMEKDLHLLCEQDYNIIWQTGKNYQPKNFTALPASAKLLVSQFIYEMDLAYSAADVVISRAGALSIAELQLTGKATILVPSPNVSEDHQTQNAMALVKQHAAILIKDAEAKEALIPEALRLMHNHAERETLSKNISAMALHQAAEKIANELLSLHKL
jgi:UDP-N-acetylglucosamine--N-acetylmuramyl-(pentapeptide) pyrophosphoryl-undecaprenol N-acetylglucosamine transferase